MSYAQVRRWACWPRSPWLHAATPAGLLTRKVPSTGEALPVIGAGTSGSFEVEAGSAEYQQLKAVLKAFFDGGGG
jgi:hypothetical protein